MEVNITEFRSNIKKYIGKEFYLVSNDKIIGHFIPAKKLINRESVQIENKSVQNTTQNVQIDENVATKPINSVQNVHFGNHACGCKKGDTRTCPKHHRI